MKRRAQRGYALLVICFLAAAAVIMTSAAVPNLLTESRREQEEELIWRGEQYARAVRLFYRKNGRFPQSFEDLTEPRNNIRFMRKAYTDPMNRTDGSWRLIYVGPSGQLIGSVSQQALQGFSFGGPAGAQTPRPPAGKAPQAPAGGQAAPPPQVAKAPADRIFGGNIIGVASKVERAAIKVYKGGTNYNQWEFIWDPTKEVQQPGQTMPGVPGLQGIPTQPGKAPGGPATPRPRQMP